MDHQRPSDLGEQTTTLLNLAVQLRASAADVDRPDVVAKVDDVILLIVGEGDAAANDAATKADTSKSDTVLRLLNGLGF